MTKSGLVHLVRVPLRRFLTAAAGSLVLVGALAAAAQPSASQSVTGIPGFLNGVSAVSASDAWAVGFSGTSNQPLIVHWNGTRWSQVTSPNAPFGSLYGVSMVSATDGWAVGTCQCTGGGVLILHWNGSKWTRLPNPASPNGSLRGVSMLSATDGWAVGLVGEGSRGPQAMVLHWNGTRWAQVPAPVCPQFCELDGVSAASASDAWAVGSSLVSTLTLHWNGTRWAHVASPTSSRFETSLAAVRDTPSGNAWAVGTEGGYQTLTVHWTGTAWRHVPSPSPGHQAPGGSIPGNELTGVAILSRTNAWSVGDYTQRKVGQGALILRWNGTSWARVANPNQNGTTDTFLRGISMASATDGWAVGGHFNSNQVVILHWNGTTWSRS